MRWFAAALILALTAASPVAAHKLKVFAAVEGHTVRGYAFFIGGGRPEGSAWTAKDAAGGRIGEGTTDAEGRFAFDLPTTVSTDVTITVDTHEAHIASTTLAAARFTNVLAEQPVVPAAAPRSGTPAPDDARLAALVSAAVQREVEPLLERLEAMDSRVRLTDVLSGIFLIIGLVGIGLWVRGRHR
ncbi:cobalamin biosynthesis protein CbiL [Xanthobacter sediminis]